MHSCRIASSEVTNFRPSRDILNKNICEYMRVFQPDVQPEMCPTYGYYQVIGSPQQPCKLLRVLDIPRCHGRGREFESRRPRHSFQKSCTNFAATNEGAKGHVLAPFLHPFSLIRAVFTGSAFHRFDHSYASAVEFVSEAKTSARTAACAACFAGEIACV